MTKQETLALPVGVTLDRFIKRQQSSMPFASGELSQLLRDVALASKIINREINRAGLVDITGAFGNQNVQGEDQQKLDVVADIRFLRALKNGGEVCAVKPKSKTKLFIQITMKVNMSWQLTHLTAHPTLTLMFQLEQFFRFIEELHQLVHEPQSTILCRVVVAK
jgi:hypothetical protein